MGAACPRIGRLPVKKSFDLTNYSQKVRVRLMEDQILLLQRLYPRIYIACHTEHVKAASSAVHLSARDSAILAHFRDSGVLQPSELARHLGIARSTMSQALKKLVSLGYVAARKNPSDRRELSLHLTGQGRKAMQAASVLDYGKVKSLLRNLSPAQRQRGLDGLALLAKAAGKTMLKAAPRKITPPETKKEKP